MTIRLLDGKRGADNVPLTLKLALEFRDMLPCAGEGERDLDSARTGEQIMLIEAGKSLLYHWAKLLLDGTWFRGNGNHTSHLMVACMQRVLGNLDSKSEWFIRNILCSRSSHCKGKGSEDLPAVKDGEFRVALECVEGTTEADKMEYFLRWDAKNQTRTSKDIRKMYIRQHEDLAEFEPSKIGQILPGVLKAAKLYPTEFGFHNKKVVSEFNGTKQAKILDVDGIRSCIAWILTKVPDEDIYRVCPGSFVVSEVWASNEEESRNLIAEKLADAAAEEGTKAEVWVTSINKKRGKKPTLTSLIDRGRSVVKAIREELLSGN